jgi:hypothetical protein
MWPPVAVGGPLVLGLLVSALVGDPLTASPVTRALGWLLVVAFAVWNGRAPTLSRRDEGPRPRMAWPRDDRQPRWLVWLGPDRRGVHVQRLLPEDQPLKPTSTTRSVVNMKASPSSGCSGARSRTVVSPPRRRSVMPSPRKIRATLPHSRCRDDVGPMGRQGDDVRDDPRMRDQSVLRAVGRRTSRRLTSCWLACLARRASSRSALVNWSPWSTARRRRVRWSSSSSSAFSRGLQGLGVAPGRVRRPRPDRDQPGASRAA